MSGGGPEVGDSDDLDGLAPVTEEFCARSPLEVAPGLLGAVLEHGGVRVRLTEVEAYAGQDDPGSHAYRGPTPRTTVMFGAPGRLYVYFSYGMHSCANLVCRPPGTAGAVLLRAGEVVAGEPRAMGRRMAARASGSAPPHRRLASGPGNLVRALGLGLADNGLDLTAAAAGARLWVPAEAPVAVSVGPRVGVSGPGGDGTTYPWRFWLTGDPSVSAYRPGVIRVRRPARG